MFANYCRRFCASVRLHCLHMNCLRVFFAFARHWYVYCESPNNIYHTNIYTFHFQTFTGNTDRTTVVENRLPTHVIAMCIRLFPLTWLGLPCLRMEVIGCNFNASGVVEIYNEGSLNSKTTLSLSYSMGLLKFQHSSIIK